MISSLLLAGMALRAGLAMRRRRLAGGSRQADALRRHLRLAKPALILILLGFIGGPLSSLWLRGWRPFERLHAYLGLLAALLFGLAGLLGLRLERGRSRAVDLHGWLGLLALLAAAAAAVAGFVLLP